MPKKKTAKANEPKKQTLYTIKLDEEQIAKLRAYCDYHMWEFYAVDHAVFAFKHKQKKVNVTAYKSGKVVIAGKGTEDFVQEVLEAEITGEARLGYDEVHHPEWYEDHAGLDEAGKGDLFGPLVAATVIATGDMVRAWVKAGIKDSKKMTDNAILRAEKVIRETDGVIIEVVAPGMARYNQMMAKPRANLNKLLAWYHAKALENALKKGRVDWGMLDQFSKKPLTQQYFKDDQFDLRMQTKAEADPVVAAASIVARARFVREIQKLSELAGMELPKGSGAPAKKAGEELFKKEGDEQMEHYMKLHFKTAFEVRGLPVPERNYKFGK